MLTKKILEKKILIIEDDLIDQMAIKRLFKRKHLPYPFTMVSSISDAKIEFSKQEFQLVISDYNLADGTAFNILEDLKNIPLIVITGNEETSTVESLINKSNAIACFTKDLDFKYLEELPSIIHQEFEKKTLDKKATNNNFTKRNNLVLHNKNVTVKLKNAFKIFDGKKEDVQETIEIFIYHKPREMNDLYQYLNEKNCAKVSEVAHRMKSGYRVLGMKKQEELANYIEQTVKISAEKCACPTVTNAFKQLSSDTKIAIDLLQKELPLLL